MKLYLLPGLGFDHRVFSKLNLGNYDLRYINWIEPYKNESLENYALRLSEKIEDTSEPIVLIGHSLGGILSQEIARIKKIDTIILISSIQSRAENPFYFKIIQPLRLHYLFTKQWTTKTVRIWGPTHGYETKEEQTLFKSMVNQHSNHYLQWALKNLSMWRPSTDKLSAQIIQIHGDKDKTFPIRKIEQADSILEGGSHFMVFRRAAFMSRTIVDILESINTTDVSISAAPN